MSPAAQRRERRMPQVPADAFLPRAKGRTTKSLRPAAAAPGLPYVHEYTFASIRRRSRLTLFCLFPRRAIMSVPGYAENLPFSRRRWRGAGISANYFVIYVVKTTEFGFSETKIFVRCAAADGRICGGIRRPCPRRHSVGKDGCRRFPRTHSYLGRRDGQPNPSVRQQPRRACRMCTNIRSHRPGGAPVSRCFACSRAGLAVSHLFCLGGGARNLVCLPRRTRSPVRFRFGCSISMLGVLPHIFSRFPAPPRSLRCAGRECPCAPPFASKTDPEPPRAPFSPNTYPAWGAEHPRAGARRAPRSSRAMRNPRDSSE